MEKVTLFIVSYTINGDKESQVLTATTKWEAEIKVYDQYGGDIPREKFKARPYR